MCRSFRCPLDDIPVLSQGFKLFIGARPQLNAADTIQRTDTFPASADDVQGIELRPVDANLMAVILLNGETESESLQPIAQADVIGNKDALFNLSSSSVGRLKDDNVRGLLIFPHGVDNILKRYSRNKKRPERGRKFRLKTPFLERTS